MNEWICARIVAGMAARQQHRSIWSMKWGGERKAFLLILNGESEFQGKEEGKAADCERQPGGV